MAKSRILTEISFFSFLLKRNQNMDLGGHVYTYLEVHLICLLTEFHGQTVKRFEKMQISTYFGPQIGSLKLVYYTLLNVAPMRMQNKIDVNPVETSWQNSQNPEFRPIWGQKWPKYLGLWCQFLPIFKSICNKLINQVSRKSSIKHFTENDKKYLYFDLFGTKKVPKIWLIRTIFHTHKVLWSYNRTFFRKLPKISPNSNFEIFLITNPWKNFEAKYQDSNYTYFWAILLSTFSSNIGTIGWKLRESIKFEKNDGRT